MYTSPMDSCCTCATILSTDDSDKSQPLPSEHRRLACCGRIICKKCMETNRRFAEYCPYCQISSVPSALPQRLKCPPSYTSVPSTSSRTTELSGAPPPYSETAPDQLSPEANGNTEDAVDPEKRVHQDTLHFLNHEHDTITSLSFRYGVPAVALRRANNLASDHLLYGRRAIIIPGEFYKGGVSLSPRPVEGEEEELRKNKIRRFMTVSKVHNYDVALLYLEQSWYDLEVATETYLADEQWERNNPQGRGISRGKQKTGSSGFFWNRS